MPTVECDNCGTAFTAGNHRIKRSKTLCCSRECSYSLRTGKPRPSRSYKINLRCAYCSEIYQKPPSQAVNSVYCTKKCYTAFQREGGPRGAEHWNYKRESFTCDNCGERGERIPARLEITDLTFCDTACKAEWQREHLRGENNPSYQGEAVQTCCETCGRTVTKKKTRHLRNTNNFCSHGCYAEWRNGRFTGEENVRWAGGGVKYYGPDWRTQRRRARQRDEHECQECGIHRDSLGRELDVHHIMPFREFGYVPGENKNHVEANRLDNLVSLCPSCHKRIERELEFA